MDLTLVLSLDARLRFIGPNPYYSSLTFPQDARLFKTHASLLFGRRLSLGLFMDLPVYYDKWFSTEISGEEGDYFKGLTDDQPAIRTPVGFLAIIIWRW